MKRPPREVLGWYGGPWQPPYFPPGPEPPDRKHTEPDTAVFGPPDQRDLAHVGVVLGRFYPPHVGHRYLVERAFAQCGILHVLSPQPGNHLAFQLHKDGVEAAFADRAWVQTISTSDFSLSHDPTDNDFAKPWAKMVRDVVSNVTRVFSSDRVGAPLVAEALGAEHVLIDPDRSMFPVSSSQIRADPYRMFNAIAPDARSLYAVHVGIVGAEGSGKTTLAHEIAAAIGATVVTDPLRAEVERTGAVPSAAAFADAIVHAHDRRAEGAAQNKTGVVVVDHSVMQTRLWAARLGVELPPPARLPGAEYFDLWIVCHGDFAFDAPPERDDPVARARLAAAVDEHLRFVSSAGAGRKRVDITGSDGPARVRQALDAIADVRERKRLELMRAFSG